MAKGTCVVVLVAIFSLAAMAQDAKAPALGSSGDASHIGAVPASTAPPVQGTIIFYGGDSNPSDPNVQGFTNENTLHVANSQTYAAVVTSAKVTISSIFVNHTAAVAGVFDPATGTYDIRTGVSPGRGGTSVAHGSGPQTATATGRLPFGLTEYTTQVMLTKPLTATPGTYWFNETPQCTNTGDNSCYEQDYYFDNTTQETNGVDAGAQVAGQLYLNSAYFGFAWTNWCAASIGQNAEQCARGSFGLTK